MVTKPLALLCGLALLASSGLAPACTAQREDFRDPDVERARGVGETREYDIAAEHFGMSEKDLETALKPFRQVTTAGRRRDGTGNRDGRTA